MCALFRGIRVTTGHDRCTVEYFVPVPFEWSAATARHKAAAVSTASICLNPNGSKCESRARYPKTQDLRHIQHAQTVAVVPVDPGQVLVRFRAYSNGNHRPIRSSDCRSPHLRKKKRGVGDRRTTQPPARARLLPKAPSSVAATACFERQCDAETHICRISWHGFASFRYGRIAKICAIELPDSTQRRTAIAALGPMLSVESRDFTGLPRALLSGFQQGHDGERFARRDRKRRPAGQGVAQPLVESGIISARG